MIIQQYLDRIQYRGPRTATKDVLFALQKCHVLSVPFENLNIHLGIPINLSIDKLFEKIVINKRGGFCYELNGLFYELLHHLGFDVIRISARTYNQQKADFGKDFDHFSILARIGDKVYLCDVGFGEFTFQPLLFELGIIQKDPRGFFVMERHNNQYYKVCKLDGEKRIPEYIFTTQPRLMEDYAEMCLYHQTSPESHFTKKRLITLPHLNGRITITGDVLKIKNGDKVEETEISSDEEFRIILKSYFDVEIK